RGGIACSRQQCRAPGRAPGARLLCGLSGAKHHRRQRAATPDFHPPGRLRGDIDDSHGRAGVLIGCQGGAGGRRWCVRRERALGAVRLAGGGGYALAAEPGLLDAARCERLTAAAREALQAGAAAAAADRFAAALGLWRGRALADVAEVEPLAREAARLEEVRL